MPDKSKAPGFKFQPIICVLSLLTICVAAPLHAQENTDAQAVQVKEAAVVPVPIQEPTGSSTQEAASAPASPVSIENLSGKVVTEKAAPQKGPEPISVNADTVEYSMDNRNVTATGNVIVIYKGAKLICQKLTLNTETKEGRAEGGVRLEDQRGIIEAEKMDYNFQTKAGIMYDTRFRANPYFGRADKVEKVNDIEFIGLKTQMSTCNFDHPHYRMTLGKVDFFRGDKIVARNNVISLGQERQIPILYLPYYNRSLKDPKMHVQVVPGNSKDWGPYMLTAWRYTLNKYIDGRILLDVRSKLGVAEGFTANYTAPGFGLGNFKLYYTQERDKSDDVSSDVNVPKVFERYLVRLRHKWDIDENTNLIGQYWKIKDAKNRVLGSEFNFLKDYFYREYEKDTQPLSFVQVHHNFSNSTVDLVLQKRTNRWYSQLEKLPEIVYNLASSQIGDSSLFFENSSTFANYNNKNAVPSPSTDDLSMWRFDTFNKFSHPLRIMFFQLNPFVANRTTYYDDDNNGASILPRTVFYSGADLTTKFYRMFNVKKGFLGLEIDGLRHVISPTITYAYNRSPTIPSSKLKQIDSIDSIAASNSISFELSNKLQTKRKKQIVDLVDFRINSSYEFKGAGNKDGGTLTDFLLNLDILPYSWMSFHNDATFSRDGHHFTNVNTDLNFVFATDRTIGLGHRYLRGDSKEFTFNAAWRLNPKWKVVVYERYQYGNGVNLSRGLREQEYTLVRDLHCWTAAITWNISKGKGESVWFVFRLKAFPELQFELDQSYHRPKPGSQSTELGSEITKHYSGD